MGFGKAAEMCCTGDRVPAEEAHRIGLADRLCEREELLAHKSPFALHLTKH